MRCGKLNELTAHILRVYMFYEVVYNRESPGQITGKSSFYKVLSDI